MSSPVPQVPERGLGPKTYVLVAVSIAVLTVAAVALAYTQGAPHWLAAAVLLVLAAGGVALEVFYYMHLKVAQQRKLFAAFFGAGVGFAVLMAGALAALLQFAIPAR